MFIADEADYALVNRRFLLDGDGLFLGLTATSLTHASAAEREYLSNRLGFLSISAGIKSKIEESILGEINIADFFE